MIIASTAVGGHSHTGHQVYRCNLSTRDRTLPVTHVARVAAPVDEFIRKLVIARMSRDDAADLIARPDNGIDVTALREESAAIRRNLDELAADCALGLIDRSQMLAATERANHRLGQIGDQLIEAGRENVLAELVTASSVATTWDQMDLSRQRRHQEPDDHHAAHPRPRIPPRLRPRHRHYRMAPVQSGRIRSCTLS